MKLPCGMVLHALVLLPSAELNLLEGVGDAALQGLMPKFLKPIE